MNNTAMLNVNNSNTNTNTNTTARKTKQQSNKLCVWCDQPRTRHDLCNRCRQKVESRAKRLMEQKLKGDWLLFNELKDYVATTCKFLKTPDQTMEWLEIAGPWKYLALQARNTYDGKRQNNAWQITDSMLLGCVKDLYAHKKVKSTLDGQEVKLTNALDRESLIRILEQKCEEETGKYRQKWGHGHQLSSSNNMRDRPGRSDSTTRPSGMSPLQPLPPQIHQQQGAMLAASSLPDDYDSQIPPSISTRNTRKAHLPTVQKGPGGIRHVDSPSRQPVKLSPSLREQLRTQQEEQRELRERQRQNQRHRPSLTRQQQRLQRQFVNVSSLNSMGFVPIGQQNMIQNVANFGRGTSGNNSYPFGPDYFTNSPNYGSVRGSGRYGMSSKRFNPMSGRRSSAVDQYGINSMGGDGNSRSNVQSGGSANRSVTNTVAESEGEIKSVISSQSNGGNIDFEMAANVNMNMGNMNNMDNAFMFTTPSMATKFAANNLVNYDTPDFHGFDMNEAMQFEKFDVINNNGEYDKLGSVDVDPTMQFNFEELQHLNEMGGNLNAELNELSNLGNFNDLNMGDLNALNEFNVNDLNNFEDHVDCLQFQTIQDC